MIRHATLADLNAIKHLADENRESLGFVLRPVLAFGIERQWLLVADRGTQVVGFAHYRHRRDSQTTLYELCIQAEYRGQGIGRALINHLQAESQSIGKKSLVLKTPIDLQANHFYQRLGFVCRGIEPGKSRALRVWEWSW